MTDQEELKEELRRIADRLTGGEDLTALERQLACDCLRDWVRLKESNTGRPRKWQTIKEKNDYFNAKRRGKPLPDRPTQTKKGDR
jgi:hypothetical protein